MADDPVVYITVYEGIPGVGVPVGGTTGQVLAKASGTDYDTAWVSGGGGGAVSSVFGRTGAVTAQSGDYAVGQVTNAADAVAGLNSNISVFDALDPAGLNFAVSGSTCAWLLAHSITANRVVYWTFPDAAVAIEFTGDATLVGLNTGDQTSIVGITGTMAEFDTACTDGNFVFSGGALGTPSSGTLTNCTGIPAAGLSGTVPVANGGTGSTTATSARANLVCATAGRATTSDITTATQTIIGRATAGTGALEELSASQARTVIGVGTLGQQAASAVAITGGTLTGVTVTATPGGLGVQDGFGAFAMFHAYSDSATANRTVTWALGDASRSLTLLGNLTLSNAFTTSGGHAVTLTTTATTTVTLPTSGILANRAAAYAFAAIG